MSKKLGQIKQQILEAEAVILQLKQQETKERGNNMFKCVGCEGMHKVSSCEAYEPHHYNSSAYEEGWESDHELWAVCPKTGIANRFLFSQPYTERQNSQTNAQTRFYWDYSRLFKSLTDTNRRSTALDTNQDRIQWKNNYYIDENRTRFGLPENRKCDCKH